MEAEERGLRATTEAPEKRRKTWDHTLFRAPQITRNVILCVAWNPLRALPDNVAALKAALIAERARQLAIAAELAVAQAKASEDMALIAAQKLRIAKLERQVYGQRSERSARLIDQLALEFEELAASATEDELAAEQAAAKTTTVRPFTRRRAERDTFPDHLPRERVVIDPPTACACCGGNRLRKLGEDVTRDARDGVPARGR